MLTFQMDFIIFGFFALKVDSNDSTNFKIHKKEYPIRLGQTFSQFLSHNQLKKARKWLNFDKSKRTVQTSVTKYRVYKITEFVLKIPSLMNTPDEY